MSVEIRRTEHDVIYVNDKLVRKDSDGNWVATEELTSAESKAFYTHLNNENLSMANRLN